MARRNETDQLEEMRMLLDSTVFCCCPECGDECIINHIDHGDGLDVLSIDFSCSKCGRFKTVHNVRKGEWNIEGSGLYYLPGVEGNDIAQYQRFDYNAYPTRREALEARYEIMEALVKPLLDIRSYDLFEKIDKEIVDCCRELSDMGVAKYKGFLARFLLSRSSVGMGPATSVGKELIEEIESLIRDTDFDGMSEALISVISFESNGLDSGIDVYRWADMFVDKCHGESEELKDSDKVLRYLKAARILTTLGDVVRSHKLTNDAIDMIKKGAVKPDDAEDLLAEAYSYTDPSLNSFETSKEIFEFFRGFSEIDSDEYAGALFEFCLQSEEHPEIRDEVLSSLEELIEYYEDEEFVKDYEILSRAYYTRYRVLGKSVDLTTAFNMVAESGELIEGGFATNVAIEYLHSVRNNPHKARIALRKLGLKCSRVDDALEILNESLGLRNYPLF